MNLNIRRKVLEYESLKYELEETEILSKEYFERFVNEVFPDKYNNLYVDSSNGSCPRRQQEEIEQPPLTDNFKKIYKKLTLKLHPDRNQHLDEEDKKENEEEFKELLESYETGDYCNLLIKARELRVKIPQLSDEEITILDKNVSVLKEKITRIKKQTSWVWCTTTNPLVKEQIKKYMKKTIIESVVFDWIIEEVKECPICLEDLIVNKTEKRLICGHIFHKECILTWFGIKFACPLCRKSFE